jgi:hypothetical protein
MQASIDTTGENDSGPSQTLLHNTHDHVRLLNKMFGGSVLRGFDSASITLTHIALSAPTTHTQRSTHIKKHSKHSNHSVTLRVYTYIVPVKSHTIMCRVGVRNGTLPFVNLLHKNNTLLCKNSLTNMRVPLSIHVLCSAILVCT